jgi:hypothetical protein
MKQKNIATQSLSIACSMLLGMLMFSGGLQHLFMNPIPMYDDKVLTALYQTGYLYQTIGVIEIVLGGLIFFRQFLPLALVLLTPLVLMIFGLHVAERGTPVKVPGGIVIGTIILVPHLLLLWDNRAHYKSLFVRTPQAEATPSAEIKEQGSQITA